MAIILISRLKLWSGHFMLLEYYKNGNFLWISQVTDRQTAKFQFMGFSRDSDRPVGQEAKNSPEDFKSFLGKRSLRVNLALESINYESNSAAYYLNKWENQRGYVCIVSLNV